MVRLSLAQGVATITVKEGVGVDRFDKRGLVVDDTFEVDPALLERLRTLTRTGGLWDVPVPAPPPDNPATVGVDGATWILEGARNGEFFAREVGSPDSGAFREACLELVDLSGIKIPPDEVY